MSANLETIAAGDERCVLDEPAEKRKRKVGSPFSNPRDFLCNRFVYLAISPRAWGLSLGINLNPDGKCNFNCVYCEVDRSIPRSDAAIDCEAAGRELEETLAFVISPSLLEHPTYRHLPPELLRLRHVALSGDGEPTASPMFYKAVETVAHIRARGRFSFFKTVLVTNASYLDLPQVQSGLALFTPRDEIWAKVDAGTQDYMNAVNQSSVSLEKILANILETARRRPVVIQSLFSSIEGRGPDSLEIVAYAQNLKKLKDGGAQIPLVQIYSATRPKSCNAVQHLPLRRLSEIAAQVRSVAGLPVEVF